MSLAGYYRRLIRFRKKMKLGSYLLRTEGINTGVVGRAGSRSWSWCCLTWVYYDLKKKSLHEGTALLSSLYRSGQIPAESRSWLGSRARPWRRFTSWTLLGIFQGAPRQSGRLFLRSRTVAQSLVVEARAFGFALELLRGSDGLWLYPTVTGILKSTGVLD